MKTARNQKVTDYIGKAGNGKSEILESLRDLIHDTIPETSEDLKFGMPVFAKKKIFTYLKSNKHHINLGFYNIERISDPNGLLEGSGKNMRHLKVKTMNDIDAAQIKEWLMASIDK